MHKSKIKIYTLSLFWILCFGFYIHLYAQDQKKGSSIEVNGDIVEYSAERNEIIATGNVIVIYGGSKLTCQKLTVNPQTKEGVAEGNVRLEDQKGIIEGSKITYNFQTKVGTAIDPGFRANPYFGKSEKLNKVSDAEIIALSGYVTTCSFDNPHYRIKSKQINLFPGDKLQTKQDTFLLGKAPLLYLPRLNQSLKDPFMHVRVMPGDSKDWGPHMLTAWRYNLTDDIRGRVYLDYRQKLGVAEGFGANYDTRYIGNGDFKYYYTQERTRGLPQTSPAEFQRYLVRLRHKWDIDVSTNLTTEIYKINDEKRKTLDSQSNILKDYFFREYEIDSQPLSYALFHHSFQYSSLDVMLQKRMNHWYDQLEKTPEIKYTLPSLRINESPFYFENNSSFANLDKKALTSPVTAGEEDLTRFDTTNKFFLPMKAAFLGLTPFVASRQTVYDRDAVGGDIPIRTVFYTGLDLSTKFYRTFNVDTGFLGMEINGLRHIITPTLGYAYNHEPTIGNSKLKQIDSVDSLSRSNSMKLELSNKLQTKRKDQSVDLLDFLISSSYVFKPKTGDKLGSNLSDLLFDLKLLPYSWLRVEADTTYKHSGNRSEENYNKFSNANYDISFGLGAGRSFGIGERYQRKGGNLVTYNFNWRFNPKWGFSLYHRFENGHDPALKRGLKEQEYIITRDLHCWAMDFTYNVKREEGEAIWLVFKLKAFPETEFGFDQSYHQPKTGSQSNP